MKQRAGAWEGQNAGGSGACGGAQVAAERAAAHRNMQASSQWGRAAVLAGAGTALHRQQGTCAAVGPPTCVPLKQVWPHDRCKRGGVVHVHSLHTVHPPAHGWGGVGGKHTHTTPPPPHHLW